MSGRPRRYGAQRLLAADETAVGSHGYGWRPVLSAASADGEEFVSAAHEFQLARQPREQLGH